MIDLSKHDRLIATTRQLNELAKELKEATIYEQCSHDVRPLTGRKDYYLLFEKTGNTTPLMHEGPAKRIRTYLERRGIEPDKVYNYHLIKQEEPKDANNT